MPRNPGENKLVWKARVMKFMRQKPPKTSAAAGTAIVAAPAADAVKGPAVADGGKDGKGKDKGKNGKGTKGGPAGPAAWRPPGGKGKKGPAKWPAWYPNGTTAPWFRPYMGPGKGKAGMPGKARPWGTPN